MKIVFREILIFFQTIDNLAVLLDADGASLFLVEGSRTGRQSLVSKVFDVHSGASPLLLPGSGDRDTEIHVPWGVGVLGHVADTGEVVNLQVACEVRVDLFSVSNRNGKWLGAGEGA